MKERYNMSCHQLISSERSSSFSDSLTSTRIKAEEELDDIVNFMKSLASADGREVTKEEHDKLTVPINRGYVEEVIQSHSIIQRLKHPHLRKKLRLTEYGRTFLRNLESEGK